MSRRSMIRSRTRDLARAQRGRRGAGKRLTLAAGAALGAGAALAPTASADIYPVINTADSGPGSLRQALIDSNVTAAADVITFGPAATGTISLISGELPISSPVDIQGPGATKLNINGQASSREFLISAIAADDQPVRIAGVTLSGGMGFDGGAVFNTPSGAAELTIEDALITGNTAVNAGGGVSSSAGSLTIIDSTISGNDAPNGGGIRVDGTDGDQETELTITGTRFSGNRATGALGDGGAGLLSGLKGDSLIRSSTISGNSAPGDGAGFNFSAGISAGVTVDDSTFFNNQGLYHGGALAIRQPTGPVLVQNSTLYANSAKDGAGAYLLNQNHVPVTIANSTIAANSATVRGGGIHHYPAIPVPGEVDQVVLTSTIVAGNSAPVGPDLRDGSVVDSTFQVGFSLIGNTANSTIVETTPGSNHLDVAALLGPLAANGGPTDTMLPALTSPAIDAGTANGLTLDQRGLPRTVDQPESADATGSDGTDIGAVEVQFTAPPDNEVTGAVVKAKKKQKQTGREIKVKLTAKAAEPNTVLAQGEVKVKKKRYPLQEFSRINGANVTARLTLNPRQGRANRKIEKALDRHKKVTTKLTVTLTDEFGNTETRKLKVRLK